MISISMYCTEVFIDEIIEKLNMYVKIIRVENICQAVMYMCVRLSCICVLGCHVYVCQAVMYMCVRLSFICVLGCYAYVCQAVMYMCVRLSCICVLGCHVYVCQRYRFCHDISIGFWSCSNQLINQSINFEQLAQSYTNNTFHNDELRVQLNNNISSYRE